MSASCLFCKIALGEIPAEKVFEAENVLAFRDIHPQAPTHLLVIHRQHTGSLSDSPDNALLGELLGAVRDAADQFSLSDYRTVINNGSGAGQSVFHLHAHLLAGRPLLWPPG